MAVFIKFGLVTSVLFFLKNVIVIASLLYFNVFIGYYFKETNSIRVVPPASTTGTHITPNGGIANDIYQSRHGQHGRYMFVVYLVTPYSA